MSKYVTLHSTITSSSLALAKSTIPTAPVPAPTVYSTPYTSLSKSPHISILIHTLKKGSATSMLPYLVRACHSASWQLYCYIYSWYCCS